jgi:F1F0 ATPase subunit 2
MKTTGLMDLFGPGGALGPLAVAGTEIAPLIVSLVLGLVLGASFFGGLWWTVRRGLVSGNPALWFGLSALGRMACVFAGFYFLARGGGFSGVLACLLGLLIARAAVTRIARRAA